MSGSCQHTVIQFGLKLESMGDTNGTTPLSLIHNQGMTFIHTGLGALISLIGDLQNSDQGLTVRLSTLH